jgi:hypothetical protein
MPKSRERVPCAKNALSTGELLLRGFQAILLAIDMFTTFY